MGLGRFYAGCLHRLQLRHIDRISVIRTGSEIGDLAGESSRLVADGKSAQFGLPRLIRVCGFPPGRRVIPEFAATGIRHTESAKRHAAVDPGVRIIAHGDRRLFFRTALRADCDSPISCGLALVTDGQSFFALDGQIVPQGDTSLSAIIVHTDNSISMTDRRSQTIGYGTGAYHDAPAVHRVGQADGHVLVAAAGVLGVDPLCRIGRIFFRRIADQVPHTDDRILFTKDFCQLMVVIIIIRAEYGIMSALHLYVLTGDDAVVSSVFIPCQFVVISENGTVYPFRRRGNTEHDAVFRLGAVIVIVAAGSRFRGVGAVIMHFRGIGGGFHCFQLAQVDRVGFFRCVADVDDLPQFVRRAYGNGAGRFAVQFKITECALCGGGKSAPVRQRSAAEGDAAFFLHVGVMADQHGIGDFQFFLGVGRAENDAVVRAGELAPVAQEKRRVRVFHRVLGADDADVIYVSGGIFVAVEQVVLAGRAVGPFQRVVDADDLRNLRPVGGVAAADGESCAATIRIFYGGHQRLLQSLYGISATGRSGNRSNGVCNFIAGAENQRTVGVESPICNTDNTVRYAGIIGRSCFRFNRV